MPGSLGGGVPVWVTVLGPVRAWHGDTELDLGAPQQRALLAVLAAHAGHRVSVGHLVDVLWGADPPASAVNLVQRHVGQLRRLLEPGLATHRPGRLLVGGGGGYRLAAGQDAVDLLRFRSLRAQAGQLSGAGELGEALSVLRGALGLWHGRCAAGLEARVRADPVFAAVDAEYDAAVCVAADLALRVAGADWVLAVVGQAAARNPLHEPLQARLVLLLGGTGQQAAALAAYQAVRRRLAEEVGVEPGPELQAAQQSVLRQEAVTPGRPAGPDRAGEAGGAEGGEDTGSAVMTEVRPAQLPADLSTFCGRAAELGRAVQLLGAGADQPPATMVILVIDGTAGVGKTALAVHVAHRVRDRFPDGQLYVNLRGFDPGGQVMTPAEAVRGFLDAFQVPPERIPASLDAQAALYRSLLDGKRVLVVLDNARDAEQARPLLPGTPTATVLVTSRNQLTSLIAIDGAHPLTLDLLTEDEATQLLARRLGPDRIAAEPQAVERIITCCARLPLALTIAAAHAAQSGFPLAALADELAEAGRRLDALDAGDPASQVRAVFSWSYTALSPAAARLFRLLGLHPGPDTSAPAAASLAGLPPAETRRSLAELARASLLTEHAPGRYTFHDLLSAYATDLTHTHDPDDQRRAALARLLDHYLHTAHTADRLLNPARDPITLPLTPPDPGVTPEQPTDQRQALAWLTAEHPVLLAAVRQAAEAGFDTHTWQLAWTLDTFLHRRGHRHDLTTTWQTALTAAGRLHDPAAQADAHRLLAFAHILLSRYPDAHTHLADALHLYTQTGDHAGQARSHNALGRLWGRQGRLEQALDHAQQALALYRAAGGDRQGQAHALNAVGWYHAQLGDHQQALTYCQQALTLFQELGDRAGQAATWDSIGYAHHHLAHHTQAADCYQHALHLFRDIGDRYWQASTLTHLGDTQHAADDPDAARTAWQHALDILTDLHHPDTHTLHAKLQHLPQPGVDRRAE